MNALKHMEAIFVAIATVALSVAFVTTEPKPLEVAANANVVVKADAGMPVVASVAKRLIAAGKTALI